jgi:sec-independent protein translocase protein TatA
MFGSIGMPELLLILLIALMVFGPRRLPELGRSLGQTLNEFKKGANAIRDSMEAEIEREAVRQERESLIADRQSRIQNPESTIPNH